MNIKLFVATKALINHKGKMLILREADSYEDGTNPGMYHIVGGRIEPGQRFDESLTREVREETGLDVQIGKPFFVHEWRPEVRGEKWQIIGIFFECLANNNLVKLSDEHDHYEWINPEDYKKYSLYDEAAAAFEEYLKR